MFSTGQVTEGAVNYVDASAVCGKTATGDDPAVTNNRTNLTLPQVQNCAQPIGPKWVASITNWLCYVIDAAGLEYASGRVCQDPLLLISAITKLIIETAGNVIIGPATVDPATPPHTPMPPSNDVGANGQYYMERGTGNVWGPKQAGAWASSPALFIKGRVIGVTSTGAVIGFYNALVEIRPFTGASDWSVEMPTPVGPAGGDWMRVINASDVNQTVSTAGGLFVNYLEGNSSGVPTLTLVPGEAIVIVSNAANWVVFQDSLSFLDVGRLAPALGAPPLLTDFVLGAHADGHLIKYTVGQLKTALGL